MQNLFFPPLHWMKDKLFCPTLILVSQLKRELLCVEAQITKGRQFKFWKYVLLDLCNKESGASVRNGFYTSVCLELWQGLCKACVSSGGVPFNWEAVGEMGLGFGRRSCFKFTPGFHWHSTDFVSAAVVVKPLLGHSAIIISFSFSLSCCCTVFQM